MLNTQAHMASYDDFYEALLNARLVLLLSNHIGDMAVLTEALRLARGSSPL
jgi:hypothetical protein